MPRNKIFFFTDPLLLDPQTNGNHYEFGPIDENNYRVDSKHTTNSNEANVYAVCNGDLRYQMTNDSNLYNIILKPHSDINFNGVPIRYFVYKGIRKDSIVNGSDEIIYTGNAIHIGDLINARLQQISNQLNNNIPPVKDLLGLIFHQNASEALFVSEDTDPIDKIFFESTGVKALNTIGGSILGKFQQGEIAFEIILEGENFTPTLEIARTPEHCYNISWGLPITREKVLREEVLNFLDPIAFYGMYYNKQLYLGNEHNDPQDPISKEDFDSVISSRFLNKNKIYIDIRNELGTSFNFYQNFDSVSSNVSITISGYKDDTHNNQISFYTENWPILILDGLDTTYFDPTLSRSYLKLALPQAITHNNADIYTLFLAHSLRYKKKKYGIGEALFESLKIDNSWSGFVKLGGHANGSHQNISFYHRLHYIRVCESPDSTCFQIGKLITIDNLFTIKPIDSLIKWQAQDMYTKANRLGGLRYIHLEKDETRGAMVETWVAVDKNRVIFFTVPIAFNFKTDENSNNRSLQKSLSIDGSFFKTWHTGQGKDFKLSKHELLITPSAVKCITYVENESTTFTMTDINAALSNQSYSLNGTLILAFSTEEYENIYTLSQNNSLQYANNAPIYLMHETKSNDKYDSHPTAIKYYEYTFKIIGLDENGSVNPLLVIQNPSNTDLILYTTTDHLICTNNAADIEPETDSSEPLEIVIEESNTVFKEQILNALIDIRRLMPELYKDILTKIQIGKTDYIPIANNTGLLTGSILQHRKFLIKIKYDSNVPGMAETVIKEVLIHQVGNNKYWSRGQFNQVTLDARNYYDSIQSQTPTQIRDNMASHMEVIYIQEDIKGTLNGLLRKSEKYLGYGAIEPDIVINLANNLKTDPNYNTDPFNASGANYGTITTYPGYILSKYNARRFNLAALIVHELAHTLYSINSPMESAFWKTLESHNPSNDPDGHGFHIKGNPSGISACDNEYEFRKAFMKEFATVVVEEAQEYYRFQTNPIKYLSDYTNNNILISPSTNDFYYFDINDFGTVGSMQSGYRLDNLEKYYTNSGSECINTTKLVK